MATAVYNYERLSTKRGFNDWYLQQLPSNLEKEAKKLISSQKREIAKLKADPVSKQYYIAMGFNVDCDVTYGLPATCYVAELRSSRYVHPTLRKIAHRMVKELGRKYPLLKLNADLEPSDWDVRRGMQDITEK